MGSIHHCWHTGVSFMADLLSWKTQSLAPRVASSPRSNVCPLCCLLTGLRGCGSGAEGVLLILEA